MPLDTPGWPWQFQPFQCRIIWTPTRLSSTGGWETVKPSTCILPEYHKHVARMRESWIFQSQQFTQFSMFLPPLLIYRVTYGFVDQLVLHLDLHPRSGHIPWMPWIYPGVGYKPFATPIEFGGLEQLEAERCFIDDAAICRRLTLTGWICFSMFWIKMNGSIHQNIGNHWAYVFSCAFFRW